eukprot:m.162502 g.162502  ORF g.162502 m.162502 type:complete len:348 (+) comp17088_c0_seq5:2313-3356(+)
MLVLFRHIVLVKLWQALNDLGHERRQVCLDAAVDDLEDDVQGVGIESRAHVEEAAAHDDAEECVFAAAARALRHADKRVGHDRRVAKHLHGGVVVLCHGLKRLGCDDGQRQRQGVRVDQHCERPEQPGRVKVGQRNLGALGNLHEQVQGVLQAVKRCLLVAVFVGLCPASAQHSGCCGRGADIVSEGGCDGRHHALLHKAVADLGPAADGEVPQRAGRLCADGLAGIAQTRQEDACDVLPQQQRHSAWVKQSHGDGGAAKLALLSDVAGHLCEEVHGAAARCTGCTSLAGIAVLLLDLLHVRHVCRAVAVHGPALAVALNLHVQLCGSTTLSCSRPDTLVHAPCGKC